MLIDGKHGGLPQGAVQRDVVGASMLHDQDRVRIKTPVEQYPSAVEERLARDAQDRGLAFQRCLKLVGVGSSMLILVGGNDEIGRHRTCFLAELIIVEVVPISPEHRASK